mmetsp:Transcript_9484/g.22120  ORF Transcript_9484/g.22120 Transcript_9484/m.22120 type:complete len:206 (-) Transcript_9484:124-741(-)
MVGTIMLANSASLGMRMSRVVIESVHNVHLPWDLLKVYSYTLASQSGNMQASLTGVPYVPSTLSYGLGAWPAHSCRKKRLKLARLGAARTPATPQTMEKRKRDSTHSGASLSGISRIVSPSAASWNSSACASKSFMSALTRVIESVSAMPTMTMLRPSLKIHRLTEGTSQPKRFCSCSLNFSSFGGSALSHESTRGRQVSDCGSR